MYFKNCIENTVINISKNVKEIPYYCRERTWHTANWLETHRRSKGIFEDNTAESDRRRARWSDVKRCVERLMDELP
jgi:hypothetical protein